MIPNPNANYVYQVGTGGMGGPGVSPDYPGGNGANGQIVVEEYYQ
jgi:hypothetical protein